MGRKKIIHALRLLNITDYTINYALEQLNEQEYLSTLHTLALKKLNNLKEKRGLSKVSKVYQYLYRQGFEPDRIQESDQKDQKRTVIYDKRTLITFSMQSAYTFQR